MMDIDDIKIALCASLVGVCVFLTIVLGIIGAAYLKGRSGRGGTITVPFQVSK